MNQTKIKGIIGIIFIIAMFAGFASWELYFRDTLLFENVIVLAAEKERGDVIVAEDLKELTVQQGSFENVIKDPATIIGKATLVDILPEVPLTENYFGDTEATISKDQFVFAVPRDWIYAMPQSLRATDEIFFYELKPEQKLQSGVVEVETETPVVDTSAPSDYEFIMSTRVMYAKDSSNREVVNISGDNREDASANISSIEIAVTKPELAMLEQMIRNGSKLIVLYRG